MKQKKSLWGSISILVAAVIAVMAFARGKWQTPLLIAVFALWGLWVIWALLLPSWRSVQNYRRKERQAQRINQALTDANVPDTEVAQTLLRHVNHRISGYLKAAYPNARWEWTVENPALLAVEGGTGRLRVYGIPDYDFADVVLDRKGSLACSLVKVVPVQPQSDDGKPSAPNQQPVDPQVWYELQGRKTLEALVSDLSSRGHSGLSLKEDGSICIQPDDGADEVVQGAFRSFPDKVYWSRLAKVLEQEGLSAEVWDDCISVAW